ncbi:hypothetical protein CFP56_010112, partial [Quercus suber]
DEEPTCKYFRWLNGKTCKRGSEVAPIILARFRMYKNQARVAEEKEKEASDRETTAIERENKAKRREEKARLRERIAKEKLQKYKFPLLVSWGKVPACTVSNFHFPKTLPLSLPLPLPVENIAPDVSALNPPPPPPLPTTLGGTNPFRACKIHRNSISRSNYVIGLKLGKKSSSAYLKPNVKKESILNPKVHISDGTGGGVPRLLPNVESSTSTKFYRCSNSSRNCDKYVAYDFSSICPSCQRAMSSEVSFVGLPSATNMESSSEVGYVKGLVSYMVIDDPETYLHVPCVHT